MANNKSLTILVGNIKGGCGKTTIATHLAAAFADKGLAVVIADCDRQRSSLRWLERRPETASSIIGLDWVKALDAVPGGLDRLIIDAPPAMRHREVKDLIDLSDIVVVPVQPSIFDQDATRKFLARLAEMKRLKKAKRGVALVGNRIRLDTKANAEFEAYFADLGYPLTARIRDSQLYPALARDGLAITELKSARARTQAADWAPLLELVGL